MKLHHSEQKLKLAILISGGGSNLQAFIDACQDPDYPAEIKLVLSNKADVFGLERAKKADIPTATIPHQDFADRESFDQTMDQTIRESGADFVILAGFMRILTDNFILGWKDKMVNIHPSLLPKFKGLHTHQRAIDAQETHHGATVHFVRPDLDSGPLILQAQEAILENDTADTLAKRILVKEHIIYPMAVRWIAEGKVQVKEENAYINAKHGPILLDDIVKIS